MKLVSPLKLWSLSFVIAFLILLINILMIKAFMITIPFSDTWHWIRQYRDWIEGESIWSFVFTTHNEHPYGIPTILYLLTGPDFFPSICLSVLFSIIGALFMSFSVYRAERDIILIIIAIVVSLSWRQLDIYLTAITDALPMCVTFGMASLALAEGVRRSVSEKRKVFFAAACILCASASALCDAAALGMFAATGVALLVQRSRVGLIAAAIIGIIGSVWFAAFFLPIMIHHAPNAARQPLVDIIGGLLIISGSPLFADRTSAAVTGAIVILLFGGAVWQKRTDDGWRLSLTIGFMSFVMALTIAYGRGLMGGINPGRYATFSAPLCIVALLFIAVRIKRISPRLSYAFVSVTLTVSLFVTWGDTQNIGRWHRNMMDRGAAMILDHDRVDPSVLAENDPWPFADAQKDIRFLEKNKISVFKSGSELRRRALTDYQRYAVLDRVPRSSPELASNDDGLEASAPASFSIETYHRSNFEVAFGIEDPAWQEGSTQGVCFSASLPGGVSAIWKRCLDPKTTATDRGLQRARIQIPPGSEHVILSTSCRDSCAWGWSYWSEVNFFGSDPNTSEDQP